VLIILVRPLLVLTPCAGPQSRARVSLGEGGDEISMAGAEFAAVVSNVAVGMLATFTVAQTLNASTVSWRDGGDDW
jgi:hypothetical protein